MLQTIERKVSTRSTRGFMLPWHATLPVSDLGSFQAEAAIQPCTIPAGVRSNDVKPEVVSTK